MDGWFPLGGLHVNGYFVCVGLRDKILRSVVGAVPMCPPLSPYKGASIVQFPAHNVCILGMETPLRGRSGGHTGTAPTVSFGQIACGQLVSFGGLRVGRLMSFGGLRMGRLMSFGWIARGWFCLLVGENSAHEPTPSVLYF